MSGTPLLSAEGLAKAFGGVRAVDGVSFALAPGEMLALIGPNGAGKTTCFNLVSGQMRADAGTVRLGGVALDGLPARRIARLGLARTFQIAAVCASLTVAENIQLALMARAGLAANLLALARLRLRAEADALLARLGLAALAEVPCGALAYGDVKRVELAAALATAPRILLMDEPTAGMAPAERGALMAHIRAEAKAAGLGVLFTEHDMDAVFGHADRVLVMDRGRLIADGPPEAVRADARVRAVYLGEEGAPGPGR